MIDDDSFTEIKQIFIEEADEGLDIMESGLLELNDGEGDVELINDIFRAAHSIKGGSATFGFSQIAEFTHLMETLLDQMRDGTRSATPDCIQVLLESVDCLREMMTAIKEEREFNAERVKEVSGLLQEILATEGTARTETPSADADGSGGNAEGTVSGWKIRFYPAPDIMKCGNDPARILRELGTLGDLSLEADVSKLPKLEDLDPETCYVGWNLTLESDCSKEQIDEVFDWVAEESDLKIECIAAPEAEANSDVEAAVVAEKPVEEVKAEKAPPAKAEAAPNKAPTANKPPMANKGGSIRVGVDRIESLLNLVGELVITQSMLNRYSVNEDGASPEARMGELRDGLAQLENNARELQDVAMKMRMLPIKTTFARFPRLVHDLSLQLGKKVDLQVIGERTELDKTVLEKIGDPLVHLVRNALDHGLETPDVRAKAGKPEIGVLTLNAYHAAGNIIIEVSDDGAGIDSEILLAKAIERGVVREDEKLAPEAIPYLIFHAGFSTAKTVSDVSGRGVGMDVVKRNIQDLGGRVEVHTEVGKGTKITIRLPLTLAILDGQLVSIDDSTYVVPVLSIIETVVVDEARLNIMAAESPVYRLRNEYIPVLNLIDILGKKRIKTSGEPESIIGKLLVIVEAGGKLYGMVVDDLLDQQQVVLKSLEANFEQIVGLAGATILGDGTVSLIIDIPGLIESCTGGDKSVIREMVAA